jgi:hypothetical protein
MGDVKRAGNAKDVFAPAQKENRHERSPEIEMYTG